MAVLKIRKYGDPILRRKCKPVEKTDKEVKQLIEDMVETMAVNDGAGLAAPQVGESQRIIVINPDFRKGEVFVLINPKITRKWGDLVEVEEGCLSFPGVFLKIKRPEKIEVEAVNKFGKKVLITTGGIVARIIQHEVDHLDGILFSDRLGFVKKLKFKLRKWL